jgi:hypothetical protein
MEEDFDLEQLARDLQDPEYVDDFITAAISITIGKNVEKNQ